MNPQYVQQRTYYPGYGQQQQQQPVANQYAPRTNSPGMITNQQIAPNNRAPWSGQQSITPSHHQQYPPSVTQTPLNEQTRQYYLNNNYRSPPYYSGERQQTSPQPAINYYGQYQDNRSPATGNLSPSHVRANYSTHDGSYPNNNYYNQQNYRNNVQQIDNSRVAYSTSLPIQYYNEQQQPIYKPLQYPNAGQKEQMFHKPIQYQPAHPQQTVQQHPPNLVHQYTISSSPQRPTYTPGRDIHFGQMSPSMPYNQPRINMDQIKTLDYHRMTPHNQMNRPNRSPNPLQQQQQQNFKLCPEKKIKKNIVVNTPIVKTHLRQALTSNNVVNIKTEEDIVEKTKLTFKKIPKITNIGQVDYKKITLSLKSGLLAETTWALDCLNILSYNESYRIQNTPNILICLVEYYKCFLNTIFDDLFIDTESDFQAKIMKKQKLNDDHGFNVGNRRNDLEKLIHQGEKIYLLDSTNYTYKSRNGLAVKVKNENFNMANQIDYTCLEEICDYQYFENGHTFSTPHIIQTMEPLWEMIPFIKNNPPNSKHQNDQPSQDNKRKFDFDFEAEKFETEAFVTLCPRKESYESLLKRCLCISSILRNISFVGENSRIMANYPALILVLARLLSFHHKHGDKKTFAIYVNELENKTCEKENQEASEIFSEFSFETLHMIRMNSFVTLSNLSEFLDLSNFTDKIILPLLDSLLHWTVCQSSYAKDPLPPDNLSCQMQALEILTKLSIQISNIDLILATPPFDRIENFYKVLVDLIANEDQVLRELSLIVLSHFVHACDSLSVRIIIYLDHSISNLIGFIEQAELQLRSNNRMNWSTMFRYGDQLPMNYMVKHAINTLRTLATECEFSDIHLFKRYEERLVNLTMCTSFDDVELTQIMADLVFIISNRKSINN